MGRTSENTGIKGKNLFMGARVCCTGKTTGFELPKMLRLMGKKETLQRLELIENLIT
jgi:glutamyl/glutaminyl-tRNA synthetase